MRTLWDANTAVNDAWEDVEQAVRLGAQDATLLRMIATYGKRTEERKAVEIATAVQSLVPAYV